MKRLALVWIVLTLFVASRSSADSEPDSRTANGASLAGVQETQRIAQRNVRFAHISLDAGLSQPNVMAVTQDSRGYVWFGTQEGLNRYDGRDIRVFEFNPKEPGSLSHDWIWSLYVDARGRLLVATDGGGINVYDDDLERFSQIKHDPLREASLSSDRVRVIFQSSDGGYWVGTTGGGLNYMPHLNGDVTRFRNDRNDPSSLPNDTVLAITEDRRGQLWIGTDGGGLARLHRPTGTFVRYTTDDTKHSLSNNRVSVIYETRSGELWVGTHEGGLNRFDPVKNSFERFVNDPGNPKSLAGNRVRDILEDRDGVLWIATDTGLDEWKPEYQGFAHHRHRPNDPTSLSSDRVNDLFVGLEGVLWVGSSAGVDNWNHLSDAFTYYTSDGGYLRSDIVASVAESSDGDLWVGTYGGGLSHINLRQGRTVVYGVQAGDRTGLSENHVMAVLVDQRDRVWAGTRAGGLNRIDPASGSIVHIRYPALSSDRITALYGDADGVLWVGTFGGGLNRIDADGHITAFRHDPKNAASIGSDRVLAIYRDTFGTLWIGTEDGGLNRMDSADGKFTRVEHDPENPRSISSNAAWQILESSDGALWIGTMNHGLNRWSRDARIAGRQEFERWDKGSGLRSNSINGMLEDDAGNIWISSNRSLTRLNPTLRGTRHYDRRNGLASDDFNWGARAKSRSGRMLFGSSAGLVSFFPGQIRPNTNQPPILVRARSPLQQLAVGHSRQGSIATAVLGYRDNYIAFEFSAFDYISPDKNSYRYMLEGVDNTWEDPGDMRRVTYAALRPGDYVFRVKAANNDGIWNETGVALPVRVEPAPWQTNVAYTSYASVLLLLALALWAQQRSRFARIASQRAALEAEVAQRTADLNDRNQHLEKLNEELKKASVTDSLTRIYNRRYLKEFIQSQVGAMERVVQSKRSDPRVDYSHFNQTVLCLTMIDLDGFKSINDKYGHTAGDRALLQVRDILLECIRKSDTLIRWGGDEFLIVGHTLGLAGIANLAERIRIAIAEHAFDLGGQHTASMTASIGAVPFPFAALQLELLSWEQALNVADYAAYLVKANQRDGWAILHATRSLTVAETPLVFSSPEELVRAGKLCIETSIRGSLEWGRGKQHIA